MSDILQFPTQPKMDPQMHPAHVRASIAGQAVAKQLGDMCQGTGFDGDFYFVEVEINGHQFTLTIEEGWA